MAGRRRTRSRNSPTASFRALARKDDAAADSRQVRAAAGLAGGATALLEEWAAGSGRGREQAGEPACRGGQWRWGGWGGRSAERCGGWEVGVADAEDRS